MTAISRLRHRISKNGKVYRLLLRELPDIFCTLVLENLQKSFPYSYIQAVDSLVLTSVLKMNSFVDTWDGPNRDSNKKAAHSALDG